MIQALDLIAKIANNLNADLSEKAQNKDANEMNASLALAPKQSVSYNKLHLISYLNDAYLMLARELKLFKNVCELELSGDEKLILYPKDFLACISISLDNKFLECKSFEYAMSEKREDKSQILAVFLDEGFFLSPAKAGFMRLNYYAFKKINDERDYLYISSFCENALLFYALFLAYQKLMSENSLEISTYYYKLFEAELVKIKDLNALNQGSKSVRTRFKIV